MITLHDLRVFSRTDFIDATVLHVMQHADCYKVKVSVLLKDDPEELQSLVTATNNLRVFKSIDAARNVLLSADINEYNIIEWTPEQWADYKGMRKAFEGAKSPFDSQDGGND